ncbi:phenylalanine ammonia-lyase [Aspergillus lentulus]|nr:phenylalanine ammonia-lyase [Aspergillus lentulus]
MTATPTKADLCGVSRKLYSLVREELAVPLRKGYKEHATANRQEAAANLTIGSQVSMVYDMLLRGREVEECLVGLWGIRAGKLIYYYLQFE